MLTSRPDGVYFAPDMNAANPVRPAATIAIIRPKGDLPI
jgi:hypothetical protein